MSAPNYVNEYEQVTSFDHYPTLRELLRQGGQPGLEYLGAWGGNQRLFAREGWARVPNMLEFGITGPQGTCDTIVLLFRGKPIPGAAIGNGQRLLLYDIAIEQQTGLSIDGKAGVPHSVVSQAEVERARTENTPTKPRGAAHA